MTPPMTFLNSLRRCRAALRRVDALQQSTNLLPWTSVRCAHGPLPQFDASTDELQAHLHKIRKTIIIPAHLKESQRKLVYKTKNHAQLANDPIFIKKGNESIQIEPIDRTHDVPNTWEAVVHALNLMSRSVVKQDWNNLHKLLQGMRDAGRKFRTWQWEVIIRKVGENNACDSLVICANRAQQTGLLLADVRVVRELLWAIRSMAVTAEWKGVQLKQACRYAEQIAIMIEGPKHREAFRQLVRGSAQKSVLDPLVQPDIAGVLLELWTLLARETHNNNLTSEHANRAMQKSKEYLTKQLSMLSANNLVEIDHVFTKGQEAREADYEVARLLPIFHGLREATRLYGSNLPEVEEANMRLDQTKQKLEALRETIRSSDENAEAMRNKRRGLRWMQDVDV